MILTLKIFLISSDALKIIIRGTPNVKCTEKNFPKGGLRINIQTGTRNFHSNPYAAVDYTILETFTVDYSLVKTFCSLIYTELETFSVDHISLSI